MGVLHARPDGPQDFWEFASELKSELTECQSGENLLKMGAAVGQLAVHGLDASEAEEFMIRHFTSEAMVSNLGVLPFAKRHGRLDLKAIWGPWS